MRCYRNDPNLDLWEWIVRAFREGESHAAGCACMKMIGEALQLGRLAYGVPPTGLPLVPILHFARIDVRIFILGPT